MGIILAGGKSSRMGQEKSLMPLCGEPVLAHVLRRFAPQVAHLALNANGAVSRFAGFGLPIIGDAKEFAGCGPLAGLLAGLEFAAHSRASHLASVPCDAPFLPLDLVARLGGDRDTNKVFCASSGRGPEPLFALWPVAMAASLRRRLQASDFKVQAAILALPHQFVVFTSPAGQPDPFLNLNSPDDAVLAAQHVTQA